MVPVNLRPPEQPIPADLGNEFALILLAVPVRETGSACGPSTGLGKETAARDVIHERRASGPHARLCATNDRHPEQGLGSRCNRPGHSITHAELLHGGELRMRTGRAEAKLLGKPPWPRRRKGKRSGTPAMC
jgi:hypothetical protein